MALMFPWATKEYLLWEMTIGQIVMYHNLGIEISNPTPPPTDGSKPSAFSSADDVKKKREELKRQGLIEEVAVSDDAKEKYRAKYGDIG